MASIGLPSLSSGPLLREPPGGQDGPVTDGAGGQPTTTACVVAHFSLIVTKSRWGTRVDALAPADVFF